MNVSINVMKTSWTKIIYFITILLNTINVSTQSEHSQLAHSQLDLDQNMFHPEIANSST